MAKRLTIRFLLLAALLVGLGFGLGWFEGEEDAPDLLAEDETQPTVPKEGAVPQLEARAGPQPTPTPAPPPAEAPKEVQQLPTPPTGPERLVGVIANDAGEPVEGASITLIRHDQDKGIEKGVKETLTGVSDDQGAFGFDAPGTDPYLVIVRAKGYTTRQFITRSGVDALRFQLEPAFQLTGRLVDAESGDPIVGLELYARIVGEARSDWNTRARTDDEGRFAFALSKKHAWFLRYPFSEMEMWGTSGAWLHTRWGPYQVDRSDLRLELKRGRVIAGQLQDPEGAAVDELFRVEVLAEHAHGGVDYSARRFTTTKEGGVFRVDGLREGRYLVTAKPIQANGETRPSRFQPVQVEGVVAGTEDLVIELGYGEPIKGQLIDDEGNPVTTRGYVYVYPSDSSPGSPDSVHAELDGQGGFSSPPLDPASRYSIYATGFHGYAFGRVTQVQPGDAEVNVFLKKGHTIQGQVLLPNGAPAPHGTAVLARATNAQPGAQDAYGYGYVTSKGAFELTGLGDYTYTVVAGGAMSGWITDGVLRDVKPGGEAVVLKVKKGVPASGRLLDAHGDPVRTHLLSAMHIEGDPGPGARTAIHGNEGRFDFAGLAPGKHRILAYVDGKQVVVGELDAPAKDVELRLPEDE